MSFFIEQHADFYRAIIYSNSPWIKDPLRMRVPEHFKREVFFRVKKQMEASRKMAVLIKGPRRVGKTEIQKQLIWYLIRERKIDPKKVLYLSFDDVQIQSERPGNRERFVQAILNQWAQMLGWDTYDEIDTDAYCFFDEVQVVDGWANLIKNRVERNPKIRIVLSGSAAHSIFEKSLKILLGRVISEKLPTFSFREFLEKNDLIERNILETLYTIQLEFERDLSVEKLFANLKNLLSSLRHDTFHSHVARYLREGGFPQLWKIESDNVIEKAHFIDENYVKKVTLEDLMLLQQIKKPELYERLLRHLFARPGQEYNQNKVASVLGTTAVTLADGMHLLEQTDLLIFVEKFSHKAEPLKRRNIKIYPTDLMLTFATTKTIPTLDNDDTKGAVAESLVAQTISRLRGIGNIAYMQTEAFKKAGEVDFYIRADNHDCPIEVKYQHHIRSEDTAFLRNLIGERALSGGLLITPESWEIHQKIFTIPLWAWMLVS